jgi:O-acetyl-ADP-ribose deacetylase (regulator of RNase III)
VKIGARSVAFPAISAGIYGWDPTEVARIAIATVRESPHLHEVDLVRFVLFSPATHAAFVTALGED